MLRSVPRARPVRWAWALATVAVCLFSAGLLDRLSGWSVRLLDLDAIGGLPRLFTTALFAAAGMVARGGARRVAGSPRLWWTAVAAIGVLLACAKLTGLHARAKAHASFFTLLLAIVVTAVALVVLHAWARRWDVPAGGPVVFALAVYAAAALGLDVVTGVLAGDGPVAEAAATFVEELSEALAALLVLATVVRRAPA